MVAPNSLNFALFIDILAFVVIEQINGLLESHRVISKESTLHFSNYVILVFEKQCWKQRYNMHRQWYFAMWIKWAPCAWKIKRKEDRTAVCNLINVFIDLDFDMNCAKFLLGLELIFRKDSEQDKCGYRKARSDTRKRSKSQSWTLESHESTTRSYWNYIFFFV